MIQVPEQFRPHIRVDYPPNNDLIFEEWFYKQWVESNTTIDNLLHAYGIRYYLPIFWTSYYVNHNYGNDKRKIKELQNFIDSLDKSKKYFTIVQYDDGILNNLLGIDIKIFGMGGGNYDYPLPLIAKPHPYSFTCNRVIFCNFMGAMTHKIRKDIFPVAKRSGYLFWTSPLNIEEYCFNLSRSVFTLAPRGYGVTSFRLMEAVQFGSIPVYISDNKMIPHNLPFDYGVIIEPHDIPNIDKILRSFTQEQIAEKQRKLKEAYQIFTYEYCRDAILRNI